MRKSAMQIWKPKNTTERGLKNTRGLHSMPRSSVAAARGRGRIARMLENFESLLGKGSCRLSAAKSRGSDKLSAGTKARPCANWQLPQSAKASDSRIGATGGLALSGWRLSDRPGVGRDVCLRASFLAGSFPR